MEKTDLYSLIEQKKLTTQFFLFLLYILLVINFPVDTVHALSKNLDQDNSNAECLIVNVEQELGHALVIYESSFDQSYGAETEFRNRLLSATSLISFDSLLPYSPLYSIYREHQMVHHPFIYRDQENFTDLVYLNTQSEQFRSIPNQQFSDISLLLKTVSLGYIFDSAELGEISDRIEPSFSQNLAIVISEVRRYLDRSSTNIFAQNSFEIVTLLEEEQLSELAVFFREIGDIFSEANAEADTIDEQPFQYQEVVVEDLIWNNFAVLLNSFQNFQFNEGDIRNFVAQRGISLVLDPEYTDWEEAFITNIEIGNGVYFPRGRFLFISPFTDIVCAVAIEEETGLAQPVFLLSTALAVHELNHLAIDAYLASEGAAIDEAQYLSESLDVFVTWLLEADTAEFTRETFMSNSNSLFELIVGEDGSSQLIFNYLESFILGTYQNNTFIQNQGLQERTDLGYNPVEEAITFITQSIISDIESGSLNPADLPEPVAIKLANLYSFTN